MSQTKKNKYVSIGGQAVIEGIMMRGPKGNALSIRLPDGTLSTEYKEFTPLKERFKWLGLPIIRGVSGMIDSMKLGFSCLMDSAEKSGMDLEDDGEPSKIEKWLIDKLGDKLMSVIMAIGTVLGVLLAVGLFMWLPTLIFDGINNLIFSGNISYLRAIVEGVMRIAIFVAYITLCAKMKEMNRVFQYHGAEHKTIFCYEAGLDLTVENVKKQSRFHPRCGTSFIFIMLILSIIISAIISNAFPILTANRILWVAIKLLMIAPIMGIGYEFIKYAGCHDNIFTRIASKPGLWMQRITTIEPSSDDIIEVGIASLKAVLEDDDPLA